MARTAPITRATWSNSASAATTVAVTTTGTGNTIPQAGDKILAVHTSDAGTYANMVAPTGGLTWSFIGGDDAGSGNCHIKLWSASLASTGNITVTSANSSVSTNQTLHIYAVSEYAGIETIGGYNSGVADTSIAVGGVTTTFINDTILIGISCKPQRTISAAPSGYTQQTYAQSGANAFGTTYTGLQAATGATGTKTFTLSGNKTNAAGFIAAVVGSGTAVTDSPATATSSMPDPTISTTNMSTAYNAAVNTDTPSVWHQLTEPYGTTVRVTGSITNGGLGTLDANATLGFTGPNTNIKALSIANNSGASGFQLTRSGNFFGNTNWTVEMWFKTTTTLGPSLLTTVPDSGSSVTLSLDTSGLPSVLFGTRQTATTGLTALNNGQWHHIAASWNGTTLTLYVDGASVKTTTAGSSTSNSLNTGIWWPGGRDMLLASPAYYNFAVTGTRIAAHYAAVANASYAATPATADELIVMPGITTTRAINYAATAATASASLPMPAVGTGTTYTATPATGSSLMVMPTVTTTATVNYAAQPMLASALAGNAVIPNASYAATPMLGSGAAVQPTVLLGVPLTVAAAPMLANAIMRQPIELKNRYFNLLTAQTDFDDIYYRFAETTGTDAINEVLKRYNPASAGKQGVYYGNPLLGQIGAPGNLPYVSFDGVNDYLQTELLGGGTGTPTGSLEILFRTNGDNMALFYGTEDTGGTTNIGYGDAVEIRNGRIYLRRYTTSYFGSQWVDIGGGNGIVNDNNWHHVVITNWWYTATGSASWEDRNDYTAGATDSLSIYIDGKLDRRYDRSQMPGNTAARLAIPDIVGRPVDSRVGWFNGDIATLVGRRGYSIPKYWIEQNSYAALDITPIYADQMHASATMPNAKGRGNSIRILYLDFLPIANHGGSVVENGRITDQINAISDPNNAAGWRDPITAERKLINLSDPEHIRIENYDMIYLADNLSVQSIKGQLEISTQKAQSFIDEFFINLKRAVVEQGVSWFIKQPEHAKRAGLIKNYVVENTVYETKGIEFDSWRPFAGQLGSGLLDEYDYWAWYNDPWRNRANNVYNKTSRNPYWYVDTHNAYRQRVVALEKDLTDLQGWTLAEQIQLHYPDPFTRGGADSALRYDENLSGLRIGQELIPPLQRQPNGGPPTIAGSHLIGVADADINAGTVIARGAANDYIDETITNNPYMDLATVIIVKEGDLVDGVATTGRIFMGFVDDYNETALFPAGIPGANETALQKQWQTATFRGGGGYTTINVNNGTVQGTTPSNPNIPLPADSQIPQPASVFYMWNPADQPYRLVPNGSFGRRGYAWLTANKLLPAVGDKIIKAGAMSAEVRMPAPTTGTQRTVTIVATPMTANAKMQDRTNGTHRDTQQLATPMLATAEMVGLHTYVQAPPMLANAGMPGTFGSAADIDDRITLTFDRVNATIVLYMRSDK